MKAIFREVGWVMGMSACARTLPLGKGRRIPAKAPAGASRPRVVSPLPPRPGRVPTSRPFACFDGHQFLRLTTFRCTGEGVPTPVWFAAVDSGLGVFTAAEAGKVKPIRRDGRVLIALGNFRGRLKGEEQQAVARLATGETAERVRAALTAKYGWQFRMVARRLSGHAYIEIVPAG